MSNVSPLQGKLGRLVSTLGRRGRTGGVGQEGCGVEDGFEDGVGAVVGDGEGTLLGEGEGAVGVGEEEDAWPDLVKLLSVEVRGAKIGGRVFLIVKRPELRGVALAAVDDGEEAASASTIFTLAVFASNRDSWLLLFGSIASWTWRASCSRSSEEARPPRTATSPTFTGSLSLDLARLRANFNILSTITSTPLHF